jgi:hypothetical protein
MTSELVGLVIAWLIAMLSKWGDLSSKEVGKARIAAAIILLSTLATAYSASAIIEHNQRKSIERPDSRTARYLQEASGGATLGEDVILVDDEVPAILKLEVDGDGEIRYSGHLSIIADGRTLDRRDVDDLEGLASEPNGRFIYATTSHSRTKSGVPKAARSMVLRGCLRDGKFIVLDQVSLANAFRAAIIESGIASPFSVYERDATGSSGGLIEIGMEVEGLAANGDGYLYFGFRAPLTAKGNNALMARVPASRLFPDASPECRERPIPSTTIRGGDIELIQIPLRKGGHEYGIVSLEFDEATGDLVLIGNSPAPFSSLRPIVCRWDPSKQPKDRQCDVLPETDEPYWGKQEALVLGPRVESATIFIDGDKGLGGRVTYRRSELGL